MKLYSDSAYAAKCDLTEGDSQAVRDLARGHRATSPFRLGKMRKTCPVAFQIDQLSVNIYPTRAEMGRAAGSAAAAHLRELLAGGREAAAIFASAASQVECLAALRAEPGIDWPRVTAFHMDEYVGMAESHPASFRRFIRENLLDLVPVKAFHGLRGEAPDPAAECRRYTALLAGHRPGLVILGIGENGHLAFNDPPVADFHDPLVVKEVRLDD